MSYAKRPYISLSQSYDSNNFYNQNRPFTTRSSYNNQFPLNLKNKTNRCKPKSPRNYRRSVSSSKRDEKVPGFIHEYIYDLQPKKANIRPAVDTYNSLYFDKTKQIRKSMTLSFDSSHLKSDQKQTIPCIDYDKFKEKHKLRPQTASRISKITEAPIFQTFRAYQPRVLDISPRSKLTIYTKQETNHTSKPDPITELSSRKAYVIKPRILQDPLQNQTQLASTTKSISKPGVKHFDKFSDTYGDKLWRLNELSITKWVNN